MIYGRDKAGGHCCDVRLEIRSAGPRTFREWARWAWLYVLVASKLHSILKANMNKLG